MRNFQTGATRDTDNGKYAYEGFMSPLVVESFGRYMHKHRLQKDGSLRAPDNWQKMFGDDHYAVCMDSAFRHFMDWWLEHREGRSRDGLEEAINGLIFNANAYLFKYLKEKELSTGSLAESKEKK